MLLTMRKGQEHGLVITQHLNSPNEFMHAAYRQALEALREIVRQAVKIPPPCEKGYADKLYGYSHNIIVFSGRRGQGKTSSMLSFSDAMRTCRPNCRKDSSGLPEDCGFTVLPPFDPTVLEENQSILAVILSRMYRLAEEAWQSSSAQSSGCGHSEAEKNSLLEQFQRCLSGINAIKFRKGDEIKTLHAIHEISDSSLLKDNFYKLTGQLLRFIARDTPPCCSFLVIQLDDTDFQIRKGYEILEDIRKYLTLPNVIILMATDLNMLRNALTQHYISEFKLGLEKGILGIDDLRKLESKYLDKLIPPTFTVYLPHLDDMIQQRNELMQISYIDPEEEKTAEGTPRNLLLRPGCPCRTEDFSFQSLLLRYIYRKTRIVFAEHATYMHNLIPTTLRGLAQFLGLLASMEDVPEIDADDPALGSSLELARQVQNQVQILEVNLPLFENYFLKDWVHTKLPQEKAAMIEHLSGVLPEQRCRMAVALLKRLYPDCRSEEDAGAESAPDGYTVMIQFLQKLQGQHRQTEDFYLFFAIHTFFTIQAHKTIVRQKRRAVNALLDANTPDQLLLFDFSPESTNLPVQFHIPDLPGEFGGYRITGDLTENSFPALESRIGSDYACRLLLPPSRTGGRHFSVMNYLGLFLSLGSPEGRKLTAGPLSQKDLYLVQTSAATIAINWDVQEKLQKLLSKDFKTDEASPGALHEMWRMIDNAIERINPCTRPGSPCPMIASHLALITNFIVSEDDSRTGLQKAMRAVDGYFVQNYMDSISEIYHHAQLLLASLRQAPENIDQILNSFNALIDVTRMSPNEDIQKHFNMELLAKNLLAFANEQSQEARLSAKDRFMKAIRKQLKTLYEKFGYSPREIETLIKSRGKR